MRTYLLTAIAAAAVLTGLAAMPSTQPASPAPPAPPLAGYGLQTEWVDSSTGEVTFIYAPVAVAPVVAPTAPATKPAAPATQAYVAVPRVAQTQPIVSVNRTADQVIANVLVKGFSQNIVCQNYQGALLVSNVVSVDAYGAAQFNGQGIYIGNVAGNVTIQDSYFGYNGRPRPPHAFETATPYKHDVYGDANGGTLTVQRCIFADAGNAGIQSRFLKGTTITASDFLDCSTALLLIEGGAALTGNVIYGGQYDFDGTGFTANTAIRSYWPILAQNNWIITRPGQLIPTGTGNHPGSKYSPKGAVNMGGHWVHSDPVWTPPPSPPAEFLLPGSSGNFISPDWPGGPWWGTTKGAGFTVLPAPGPALNYAPILARIEAGGSVAAADAQIRAALGVEPVK